jgi:hypothetical protein
LLQMLLFKYFARNFNAQKMDTRTHEQLDSWEIFWKPKVFCKEFSNKKNPSMCIVNSLNRWLSIQHRCSPQGMHIIKTLCNNSQILAAEYVNQTIKVWRQTIEQNFLPVTLIYDSDEDLEILLDEL